MVITSQQNLKMANSNDEGSYLADSDEHSEKSSYSIGAFASHKRGKLDLSSAEEFAEGNSFDTVGDQPDSPPCNDGVFFFLSYTTGCCGFYNPRSERSKDDKHITSLHITTPGDISLLELRYKSSQAC